MRESSRSLGISLPPDIPRVFFSNILRKAAHAFQERVSTTHPEFQSEATSSQPACSYMMRPAKQWSFYILQTVSSILTTNGSDTALKTLRAEIHWTHFFKQWWQIPKRRRTWELSLQWNSTEEITSVTSIPILITRLKSFFRSPFGLRTQSMNFRWRSQRPSLTHLTKW